MAGYSTSGETATAAAQAFKHAMRQVTSPVAIVAAEHDAKRAGLTATSICSVSADPPTLLACINRASRVGALIVASGAFSVNFVSAEQTALARLFSTPSMDSEQRFSVGTWRRSLQGAPLLDGAVSVFDCRLDEIIPCHTHNIILGRVVATKVLDGRPLLYRDGVFRLMASE